MPKRRHGKHDYLYQRPGSKNWWLRLQFGDRDAGQSLGTPDKAQAEIRALPFVAAHKARLYEARPRIEPIWEHKFAPGREHPGEDGGRIIATDRELVHLDAAGRITSTTPNGGPGWAIVNLEQRLGLTVPVPIEVITERMRPTVAAKNADDNLFEVYLTQAGVTGYFEREARSTWALFKSLTDNKPLKDATRDDGRKLARYFEDKGLKTATVKKKVGWLTAAVNLAIDDNKFPHFNPFTGVVREREDGRKRLPLSEADMKSLKANLDRLSDTDQVLLRLLACTGMRLSEAFEIDHEEMKERGVRFVIIGTKTKQSLRRVPLPAAVLPYLPPVIKSSLFKGGTPAASKRLNRYLTGCGITDPAKVVHSLRHRAQDRLRAAECPEDIRWSILGHEKQTVARDYGTGFSVPQLKRWIDKIGGL
jgi:integrase